MKATRVIYIDDDYELTSIRPVVKPKRVNVKARKNYDNERRLKQAWL